MRRSLISMLILCLAAPVFGQAPVQRTAAWRAAAQLAKRVTATGALTERKPQGFKLYERHSFGTHGVVGLALLAEGSQLPAARRLMRYLIGSQNSQGSLAPRGNKNNLEHGYALQFLLEMRLAEMAGDLELTATESLRLVKAIRSALRFVAGAQLADGSWPYNLDRTYRETATWVPLLEALLLARAAGEPMPRKTVERAMAYFADQLRPDGVMNGEKERVVSPHACVAALSVLECLDARDDERVPAWRERCRAWSASYRERGLYRRWIYEPTNPEIDQWAKLKVDLGARRKLYHLHYRTLAETRRGVSRERAEIVAHLLKYREKNGTWTSTAGDLASTALAVIALSADRRRLTLYTPMRAVVRDR